jgi:L-ribulose-5-phosphate 3-epimerase
MHIKDARMDTGEVVPSGEGDGYIAEILRALVQKGFQGFLSIEPHLNNSGPGGGKEKFTISANALKTILSSVE